MDCQKWIDCFLLNRILRIYCILALGIYQNLCCLPMQVWRKLWIVGPVRAKLVSPGGIPQKILKYRFSQMQFGAFSDWNLLKNEPEFTVKI